jgi:hypothetical protein
VGTDYVMLHATMAQKIIGVFAIVLLMGYVVPKRQMLKNK